MNATQYNDIAWRGEAVAVSGAGGGERCALFRVRGNIGSIQVLYWKFLYSNSTLSTLFEKVLSRSFLLTIDCMADV